MRAHVKGFAQTSLCVLALEIDRNSVSAARWLDRCGSDDFSTIALNSLQIHEHFAAFPATMLVMLLICVLNNSNFCDALGCVKLVCRQIAVMLVAMPAACFFAVLFSTGIPPAFRITFYGLLMLLGGLLFCRLYTDLKYRGKRASLLKPQLQGTK